MDVDFSLIKIFIFQWVDSFKFYNYYRMLWSFSFTGEKCNCINIWHALGVNVEWSVVTILMVTSNEEMN